MQDLSDQPNERTYREVERAAKAFMTQYEVPAFSFTFASRTRSYSRAIGIADPTNQEPLNVRHLFRIASVSKPITSVAIFRLIEAGSLHLTDRIFGPGGVLGNDFGAPPFLPYVDKITLEHLLTHTCGGWQNDGSDPMFHHTEMNHKELITWTLANLPVTKEPGKHYAYSNFGFCVLGRVIEKITSQSYEQFVNGEVMNRCGVRDARIAGNKLSDRAPSEVVYHGQGEDPYSMNVNRMDSHGGWLTTPSDLVRLLQRVDGFPVPPDILRSATEIVMTTASAANANYAKGWEVNGAHNWWHNGSLPGTTTIMVRAANGYCWAGLTNTRKPGSMIDGDLDSLMWALLGHLRNAFAI